MAEDIVGRNARLAAVESLRPYYSFRCNCQIHIGIYIGGALEEKRKRITKMEEQHIFNDSLILQNVEK